MKQCNTLFCIAEKRDDDLHVDVTGATGDETNSEHEVIAHVYDVGGR